MNAQILISQQSLQQQHQPNQHQNQLMIIMLMIVIGPVHSIGWLQFEPNVPSLTTFHLEIWHSSLFMQTNSYHAHALYRSLQQGQIEDQGKGDPKITKRKEENSSKNIMTS